MTLDYRKRPKTPLPHLFDLIYGQYPLELHELYNHFLACWQSVEGAQSKKSQAINLLSKLIKNRDLERLIKIADYLAYQVYFNGSSGDRILQEHSLEYLGFPLPADIRSTFSVNGNQVIVIHELLRIHVDKVFAERKAEKRARMIASGELIQNKNVVNLFTNNSDGAA
ncbi:MAG: hypothetical protein HC785_16555 [Calothrix sp. CSU_2_0]|nr:hypothetical protein [Calothrix sp. CSU_2_0]